MNLKLLLKLSKDLTAKSKTESGGLDSLYLVGQVPRDVSVDVFAREIKRSLEIAFSPGLLIGVFDFALFEFDLAHEFSFSATALLGSNLFLHTIG